MKNGIIKKEGALLENLFQKANIPVNLASEINKILNLIGECVKIHEEELTKREFIKADQNIQIEKIRAQKEIFLRYIEAAYHERNYVFNKLFDSLEKSMQTNNAELMNLAFAAIIQQINKNPIDSFGKFSNNIEKPEYIAEI